MPTLDELGRQLLAQIYSSLTGGDNTVPPSQDNFVSWCTPGIAFAPEDFDFCVKGLGGGATAEDEKRLLQQAYNFAQLVDFVPDPTGIYSDQQQQTVYRTSGARMSHMYSEILRLCKVVSGDLTNEQKSKIDKFRGLLRTTKKVTDLITEDVTEVTQDGPILQAYNEKLSAYLDAALLYNQKRVAAAGATGVEGKSAVTDWANNAALYRLKVKAAADAWTAAGYRNEVDLMNAYINQTTLRDMLLWKQRLLEYFDDARVNALGPGQEFYYTSVIPGTFATAKGWTKFAFAKSSGATSQQSSYNAWSTSAGLNFGLFSFGANASGSSEKASGKTSASSFGVEFELTQVPISRPWFYPEFFLNRGWMLRKGEGWNYDAMPSDGQRPPKGNFVAYPMLAVMARNIVIRSAELATAYQSAKSSFSAGASGGWGPFRVSGNYRRGDASQSFQSQAANGAITVPGMQIIAFVNRMLPKAPNPLPDLKPDQFQ